MVVRLLLRLVISAVVIGIVAAVVPGIHVDGGLGTLLWLAFLLAFVNLFCGTLMRLFSLPLIVLTFGLFLLVINAAVLAITAGLSDSLQIDSFSAALVGGLLLAVIGAVAEALAPLRKVRPA